MHHHLCSRIFAHCYIRDLFNVIVKYMGILTEHAQAEQEEEHLEPRLAHQKHCLLQAPGQ